MSVMIYQLRVGWLSRGKLKEMSKTINQWLRSTFEETFSTEAQWYNGAKHSFHLDGVEYYFSSTKF